jgi:hypothetical protein
MRERSATVSVPQTPMSAAMMAGSILDFEGPVIIIPIL